MLLALQFDGGGGDDGGGGGSRGAHHSGLFSTFMFILVSGVFIGGFYGWWRFIAKEAQRDTLRDLSGSAAATAKSVWGWAVDKVK